MIMLKQDEFNCLALCAFRYALGRMTYMPSLIQEILTRHKVGLEAHEKLLMIKEIDEAIRLKRAGWACDEADWLRFKEVLKDEQL